MTGFVVLDRLCRPWRTAELNEDAVGSVGAAAWVIDGATGVFERAQTPGPTDAAWLARRLDRALSQAFASAPQPAAAIDRAAEEVTAAFAAARLVEAPAHEAPSACLALAALADGDAHLFNIGDCRILFGTTDGAVDGFGSSPVETLEADLIAKSVRLRAAGQDAAAVAQALKETLRRNFATLMNHDEGYWVAHPVMPWRHRVQQRIVPAGAVRHLLIVSDGLYRLVDVFAAYDEAGLLRAALTQGLAALYDELRAHEADDPSCERAPRLKPQDDASGILIRLG